MMIWVVLFGDWMFMTLAFTETSCSEAASCNEAIERRDSWFASL